MPVCMFEMLVVKALQTLGPSDNAAACTIIANVYAFIANATSYDNACQKGAKSAEANSDFHQL